VRQKKQQFEILEILCFQVLGKCYVMCVKDYFKFRPEGFEEKDIFVCEWRYTSKIRNWKKIKPSSYWDTPDHVTIVPRDVPLPPTKIPSVFKVSFL
jgi:protein polybromo-1